MLVSAVISGLLLTLNANCQQAANQNAPSGGSNYFPYEHIANINQTSDPVLAILGNLSQAQNGSDTGFIRKDSRNSDTFTVGRSDGQRTIFGTYENKGFFAQTGFTKPRPTGSQFGAAGQPTHYYSIGGAQVPVVKNNQLMDTYGSPKRPNVSPLQPGKNYSYLRPPTTPYPIIGGKTVGVQTKTQNGSMSRPGHQGSISSSPIYSVDKYSRPHFNNCSKSAYYAADPSIGGRPVDLIHPNFKDPLLNQKLLSQVGISTRIGDFDGSVEEETETGRFGWQVSVFTKEVTPYVRVCGGSIVTSTAVISAAQCFWGVDALPAGRFAVGAAALASASTTTDEYGSYLQRIDVRDIIIPPRFRGLSSNNQADVAVLLMEKPFHFHHSLKPVCVNFDHGLDEEQLRDGSLGTVLGTGSSGILLNHKIPVISEEQCFQETAKNYLYLITSDKICALVKSTPNGLVCNHDIGSGLFFTLGFNPVPFLRGVASTPLHGSSSDSSVNTYTRLHHHTVFLLQHVPNIEKECWNHYPHVEMILKDRFGSQNDEMESEMYEDGDDDDGQFVCNCYC